MTKFAELIQIYLSCQCQRHSPRHSQTELEQSGFLKVSQEHILKNSNKINSLRFNNINPFFSPFSFLNVCYLPPLLENYVLSSKN